MLAMSGCELVTFALIWNVVCTVLRVDGIVLRVVGIVLASLVSNCRPAGMHALTGAAAHGIHTAPVTGRHAVRKAVVIETSLFILAERCALNLKSLSAERLRLFLTSGGIAPRP